MYSYYYIIFIIVIIIIFNHQKELYPYFSP